MNNVESVSHVAMQPAYDKDPVTCYNNIKIMCDIVYRTAYTIVLLLPGYKIAFGEGLT